MTNFHEFVHLHESQTARRAQPGVSPRCSNIRWQVLCHRCSKPARHITSLLTKTSDREESGVRRRGGGELPEVVNTKCKKQFGPDISVINFMPVLGPSHYKSNQIKSVRCRHVRRSPRQCLTHLPHLLYTPRGSQAADEGEARCFGQRVDPVWKHNYAILYKRQCDCLRVSLNIVKDLCNIDLTPIFNFK